MKKLIIALCLATSLFMVGCKKNNKPSSDSSDTTTEESIDPSVVVTVNFFLDYNDVSVTGRYYRCQVNAGSLITDVPPKPTTPPMPEFPTFLGWSKKEVINDSKDLWDFSKDIVPSKSTVLNLYGIWVAQGE